MHAGMKARAHQMQLPVQQQRAVQRLGEVPEQENLPFSSDIGPVHKAQLCAQTRCEVPGCATLQVSCCAPKPTGTTGERLAAPDQRWIGGSNHLNEQTHVNTPHTRHDINDI